MTAKAGNNGIDFDHALHATYGIDAAMNTVQHLSQGIADLVKGYQANAFPGSPMRR